MEYLMIQELKQGLQAFKELQDIVERGYFQRKHGL
jgi:hypothetical protein